MSDGGDGFGEIIGGVIGAEPIEVETVDAAHRPHTTKFWFDAKSKTAIIEAAQINGLALLPPGKYHPFDLDTFGLGRVYRTAIIKGAGQIIVGIGGSATNDGGFGFARSMGWKFVDAANREIIRWTDLDKIDCAFAPTTDIHVRTVVAVDVQNPLLGPNGASSIYGPQKGLRPEDIPKAEACLQALAETKLIGWLNQKPYLDSLASGAGAAGGLGFGLRVFALAGFQSGFDIFAKSARLQERVQKTDLVISGEGSMDAQSLMGKGVGSLWRVCIEKGVRFMALAGSVSAEVAKRYSGNEEISLWGIVPQFASLDQAKAEPAKYLRLLASEAAKSISA
jgi:glycerate 2-kinase